MRLLLAQASPEARPAAPATRVSLALSAPAPAGWSDQFVLRFGALDGGTPVSSAKTRIAMDDLAGGAALLGPVEPLGNAPGPTAVLAQGAEAEGAEIPGSVTVDNAGNGAFQPGSDAAPFEPLRTPVDLFGNLVDVTRARPLPMRCSARPMHRRLSRASP